MYVPWSGVAWRCVAWSGVRMREEKKEEERGRKRKKEEERRRNRFPKFPFLSFFGSNITVSDLLLIRFASYSFTL